MITKTLQLQDRIAYYTLKLDRAVAAEQHARQLFYRWQLEGAIHQLRAANKGTRMLHPK